MPETKPALPDLNSHSPRRCRYARAPVPNVPVSLTPVKVRMLVFLAELRFLSLPQLASLCCPAARRDLSEKAARRHLRVLYDAGMVDVLAVSRAALAPPDVGNDPSLLYGSAPNVYAPTVTGLKLLVRVGLVEEDVLRRPAPSYGPRNSLFLAHELAVRDVRVWLEEAARVGGHELLVWRDDEAAVIPLRLDADSPAVRPDAWFVLRVHLVQKDRTTQKQAVLVGLVEVDRGTERGERHWREKVAKYEALYGGEGLRGATGYVNARVLVLTPDAQRRDRLAAIIDEEGSLLSGRVWLAAQGALERTDLQVSLWRRPGDPTLHPLIVRF